MWPHVSRLFESRKACACPMPVHEQVRDRLDLAFEDLGEQEVKNINRPVRAWSWSQANTSEAAISRTEGAVLTLPDKPSIAVLPFDNMSGDPEQEYFADGIAEDIITGLSRIRWFFVCARNSSFIYKGRSVEVKKVSRELGVRYVLEGSVRKSGNRARITTQLIDAATGNHLWVERFDRDLHDIFAVQDEITETVVATIEPRLYAVESDRARRKDVGNIDAWDLTARAMGHLWRMNGPDNSRAQETSEKGGRPRDPHTPPRADRSVFPPSGTPGWAGATIRPNSFRRPRPPPGRHLFSMTRIPGRTWPWRVSTPIADAMMTRSIGFTTPSI